MENDLWVVTSYFNPLRYQSRRRNFDTFAEHMVASGVKLVVAEMALDGAEFELPASKYSLQLRGGANLWQKERLLNVALATLPSTCSKVAWLDCDLIFENSDWAELTLEALDQYAVVQPFDVAVWLPRGAAPLRKGISVPSGSQVMRSFGAVFAEDPEVAQTKPYASHGHTGFAWAARRELIEKAGLYDACLTGSGDHLMAHVFAGAPDSRCSSHMIKPNTPYSRHFGAWAAKVDRECKASLGFLPGRLSHLWHGDPENRGYADLNSSFKDFDFDPELDIALNASGLWEWAAASDDLRSWSARLFSARREDG